MEGVKEAPLTSTGPRSAWPSPTRWGTPVNSDGPDKSREEAGEDPPWHFIEIMACRGGCIGGGGQPYGATDEVRKKRIAGIYKDDKAQTYRCSHDNPQIQAIYKEFLGEPLSEKSHSFLHTHYTERKLYQR